MQAVVNEIRIGGSARFGPHRSRSLEAEGDRSVMTITEGEP